MRLVIADTAGWIQGAATFFLGAAIFCDVLLIRICLSIAFACLLGNVASEALASGELALDSLLWALVTGLLHWRAAASLLREELRPAAFASPDDQALFNYLHRRTGLMASDFRRLRAIGRWASYERGETICETETARQQLYIVVEGRARLEYRYESSGAAGGGAAAAAAGDGGGDQAGGEGITRTEVGSGECFDLRLLNISGVFIGFPNEFFRADALAQCTLFVLPLGALSELTREQRHLLPFLRAYALSQLARLAQRAPLSLDAFGKAEEAGRSAGARSRDFAPLRPREQASMRWTLRSTLGWLRRSINPTVESGCRHQSNPFSGSLAQASVRSGALGGLLRDLGDAGEAEPLVAAEPQV